MATTMTVATTSPVNLAVTAPTAPAVTTQVPTAATAVYHDVTTPVPTYGQDVGQVSTYSQWGGSQRQYGAGVPEIRPGQQYGAYLERQYNEPTTGPIDISRYMPTIGGQTSFDLQRQQIQGQFDAEAQRQLEILDAQLARQGVTGGAAIAARQDLLNRLSLQREQALSQVRAGEAQYMQEAAMTEAQRRFAREERLGEQAYQAELSYAKLNQEERQLYEQGRQFDNRMDFEVWAKEQGYTDTAIQRSWEALQRDRDRSLTATELQQRIDNMRNQLALDWSRLQTTVGTDRDRLLYNIYQTQSDIASAERRLAYQTWATERLHVLQSDLEQGRWEQQRYIQQRQQAYYNMGKAGIAIPDEDLQVLKAQDPLAYYAYQDGVAGLSIAVNDANIALRTQYLNTMMGALAELSGQDFISAMSSVWTRMDELFGPGGQFSLTGVTIPGGAGVTPGNVAGTTTGTGTTGTGTTGTGTTGGRVQPVSAIAPVNEITSGAVPPAIRSVYRSPTTQTWGMAGSPAMYNAVIGSGANATTVPVDKLDPITVPPAQRGVSTMYRGSADPHVMLGGAYGNASAATYNPPYTEGSPESTSFVNNILKTDPYTAARYQYTFDEPTLRSALHTTLGELGDLQPVSIPGFVDWLDPGQSVKMLSPQYGLAMMMLAAGRPIATQDGVPVTGQTSNGGTYASIYGFPPVDESNFPLLDTAYMDNLVADGNDKQLMSLAYTYANIGGYPYALIPSYDPITGKPTRGLMAVNLNNPTVQIRWEVPS